MAFGNDRTHILSTEGMINFAKDSPKSRFLVATETGIIHRLNKEAPGKRFEPVSERAICKYMKMITLEKLHASLRDWKYEVTVEPEIADRARAARSSGWSRSAKRPLAGASPPRKSCSRAFNRLRVGIEGCSSFVRFFRRSAALSWGTREEQDRGSVSL